MLIPFSFQLGIIMLLLTIILLLYESNLISNLLAVMTSILALFLIINPFYLVESSTGVISMQKIFFPQVVYQVLISFHIMIFILATMNLLYEQVLPRVKS